MSPRLILPALAALAACLGGPALADRADRCRGPVTAERAIQIAREAGVATVREVECDDGVWEVDGRDAAGREIEVEIDPQSGRVLKVDRD